LRKRVALVASDGGHWMELVRFSAAFEAHDSMFISTSGRLIAPCGHRSVLQISDGSRDSVWLLLRSALELLQFFAKFRPDVVISTGAAAGAIALFIGKLMGATTIWVDSIANSEEFSLSCKIARHYADVVLTQWEHLADESRHIYYVGRVL